jgi:hypothetical protein
MLIVGTLDGVFRSYEASISTRCLVPLPIILAFAAFLGAVLFVGVVNLGT